MFAEWSVDPDAYDPDDPADWARANPALGIRIDPRYMRKERAAMTQEGFAAELLGVGDWPAGAGAWVIPADKWHGCADASSPRPDDPVVFSIDVDPARVNSVMAVAGRRPDGMLVAEVADQAPGTRWVVARAVELDRKWGPVGWVVEEGGPAGSLIPDLEAEGLVVFPASSRESAQAAAGFYDTVVAGELRHSGDHRLTSAVAGAVQRPVGEAWAWGRRKSTADISPLVAVSLALWGFRTQADGTGQPGVFFV
jgi:hypothetical protein